MARALDRILVVDDEEAVRSLLSRALSGAGYEVSTAANGEEALVKASQLDFSAALLDIRMPGKSGMEVLRELVTEHPDICVVMVSAVDDARTAMEAMRLGAYDYLVKPFNMDEVVLKVRRAVARKRLEVENERQRMELEQRVAEQAQHLQQQFAELVETLAREHKLLYRLAEQDQRSRAALKRLPLELQKPMSSSEEFSEALLRILRKGILKPEDRKG